LRDRGKEALLAAKQSAAETETAAVWCDGAAGAVQLA
jgi:hypothetical protein